MCKIIGFVGKKRAGKNYLADTLEIALIDEGYFVSKLAFADPVKEYADYVIKHKWFELIQRLEIDFDLIGLDDKPDLLRNAITALSKLRENPKATEIDEAGKHRWLLQKIGTEVFRELVDKNYWVDLAREYCAAQVNLITDVRFPNEVELCDFTIRILGGDHTDSHSSETSLDAFVADYTINNADKSPKQADNAIKNLVNLKPFKELLG